MGWVNPAVRRRQFDRTRLPRPQRQRAQRDVGIPGQPLIDPGPQHAYLFAGSLRPCLGMTCSGSTPATILISSDSPLLPGSTARPESLSRSVPLRVSRLKPPLARPRAWQVMQRLARIGSTSRWKSTGCAAAGGNAGFSAALAPPYQGNESAPAETGQQQPNRTQHGKASVEFVAPGGQWRAGWSINFCIVGRLGGKAGR